jgi:hypothetical protein
VPNNNASVLTIAGHTNGQSSGPGGPNLVLKLGHDGGIDQLSNRLHLHSLHSASILTASMDRKQQNLTVDPARLLSPSPANAQLTNSKDPQVLFLLRLRVTVK